MKTSDRIRDLVMKVFWTAVAVAVPAALDSVTEQDVPPGFYPVYAAVATLVLAWVRSQAGHYAPPPAETVKGQVPGARL